MSQIPVNSVRLHHDEASARAAARGDLSLYGCVRCGFVWNAEFDAGLIDYSSGYESTQSYSGTYRKFLDQQAVELVEAYNLKGKTVIEIGCGHGEFLAALCNAGVGHGIGYDPAALVERRPQIAQGELTIIQEAVGPETTLQQAALIICRNTLEHVPDVAVFVAGIRQALENQPETPVFIQIPSWDRVGAEGAFWDIYYEHCSYFSQQSLSGLFEGCGFTVDQCSMTFGGQYLDLRARASSAKAVDRAVSEIDMTAILSQRQAWQTYFQTLRDQDRKVVLWGGGSKAVALLTSIDSQDRVLAAVDINPHKQGCYLPVTGHPVIGPEQLKELEFDEVLLMNGIYRDEVAADLKRLGVTATLKTFD